MCQIFFGLGLKYFTKVNNQPDRKMENKDMDEDDKNNLKVVDAVEY